MFEKLRDKLKSWAKSFTEKEPVIEKTEAVKVSPKEKSAEKKEKIIEEIDKDIKKQEKELKKIKKEIDLEKKIEEIIKEEKQKEEEIEPGKESFFKKITSKILKVKVSEKEFTAYSEELEMLLLESNVAYEVAEKIIKKLKEKIVGRDFLKKEIGDEIRETLGEIIKEILIEPFDLIEKIGSKKEKPYVILFCGINGTGKTTTIVKIAKHLKDKKISCAIAAGDTFRAASIEQLKKHGEKLGIKVISQDYGVDPASVGFDAIKYAKKNKIDCVLIDTAGRMHSEKNLLKELEKISRVCNPDSKIFVGEAITGNDSVEQIKSFDSAINIDGIILTKADTDEKGGTALSVGYVTKKPILFLGTGQEYDKIEPFDKKKFIKELGL